MSRGSAIKTSENSRLIKVGIGDWVTITITFLPTLTVLTIPLLRGIGSISRLTSLVAAFTLLAVRRLTLAISIFRTVLTFVVLRLGNILYTVCFLGLSATSFIGFRLVCASANNVLLCLQSSRLNLNKGT